MSSSAHPISADDPMTIGQVAKRTGLTPPTLRFYERRNLICSSRTASDRRRYSRDVLRRIGFIKAAQLIGFTLTEIAELMCELPDNRAPTAAEWKHFAERWKPQLAARRALLARLEKDLTACIGCGCLSLSRCRLFNPDDHASTLGPGARYLIHGDPTVDSERS